MYRQKFRSNFKSARITFLSWQQSQIKRKTFNFSQSRHFINSGVRSLGIHKFSVVSIWTFFNFGSFYNFRTFLRAFGLTEYLWSRYQPSCIQRISSHFAFCFCFKSLNLLWLPRHLPHCNAIDHKVELPPSSLSQNIQWQCKISLNQEWSLWPIC